MKTHLTTEEAKTVLEALKDSLPFIQADANHEDFFADPGSVNHPKAQVAIVTAAIRIMEAEDVKVGNEQALFEAWAPGNVTSLVHGKFGTGYVYSDTISAWKAWQARAALSAPAAPSETINTQLAAALKELCAMYGHTWDQVDGSLVMLASGIERFEKAHAAGIAALSAAAPAAVEGTQPDYLAAVMAYVQAGKKGLNLQQAIANAVDAAINRK